MRAFSILTVIAVATVVLADFNEECGLKVGVTREQHEAFNPFRDEWSELEKCYLQCELETSGVMRDGHFSDEFKSYLVKLEAEDHSREAGVVKSCVDDVSVDGCAAAYQFGGCLTYTSVSPEFLKTFADWLKSQNTQIPGVLSEPELVPVGFSDNSQSSGVLGEAVQTPLFTSVDAETPGQAPGVLGEADESSLLTSIDAESPAQVSDSFGEAVQTSLPSGLDNPAQVPDVLGEAVQTPLISDAVDSPVLDNTETGSEVLSEAKQTPEVLAV